MTIRYDVTVDDQVAFALYQLYQSGRSMRGWRTGAAVWGIVAPLGVIAIMTVSGARRRR